MRERITVRRRTEAKNSRGGLTVGWSTVASDVSAEVLGINGREALIGNVLQGVATYQVTIRFREDIKVSDQILWKTHELNILAPPEDRLGSRQWLVITASTQSPQGA